MSTLTVPAQRSTTSDDVDTSFALFVHAAPAPHAGQPHVDFETVFDLDYAQPVAVTPVKKVRHPRPTRRVSAVKPRTVAPKRVRLTRRGRVTLVLTFLALALALMVPFGGWATATLTGGAPEPVRIVEVQPGDTLYGIAGDLAEPGQIREMVHRIQSLNSLPGGQITEGQKLAVPRG
jgi:LysM domain